jgi:hypothetical protein
MYACCPCIGVGAMVITRYHDYSGTPEKLGIAPARFGQTEYGASEEMILHAHAYPELTAVVKGNVEYKVTGKCFLLTPGDVCITRPGESHYMARTGYDTWIIPSIGIRELSLE